MSGAKQILVDSDALIGLVNSNDSLHTRCQEIIGYVSANNLETIILPSTVLEAATALSRGGKRPDLAKQLLSDYAQLDHPPLPEKIFRELSNTYDPSTSASNTPFDSYLLVFAKLKHIDIIFSFDEFYKKHGLVLAQDILK